MFHGWIHMFHFDSNCEFQVMMVVFGYGNVIRSNRFIPIAQDGWMICCIMFWCCIRVIQIGFGCRPIAFGWIWLGNETLVYQSQLSCTPLTLTQILQEPVWVTNEFLIVTSWHIYKQCWSTIYEQRYFVHCIT